jgi:hypothetical protein
MPLSRELALTDAELDVFMLRSWTMRVATQGPGNRLNLTAMWYGWAGGCVYFVGRGQKIVNLRRNPSCTVLVDANERYPELVGAMLSGRGIVLEDAAAEDADPHLEEARGQMGRKYAGGRGAAAPPAGNPAPARNGVTASGRTRRWVRLEVEHLVTWDNHKLPRG